MKLSFVYIYLVSCMVALSANICVGQSLIIQTIPYVHLMKLTITEPAKIELDKNMLQIESEAKLSKSTVKHTSEEKIAGIKLRDYNVNANRFVVYSDEPVQNEKNTISSSVSKYSTPLDKVLHKKENGKTVFEDQSGNKYILDSGNKKVFLRN